jgi:hypothetical protein
MMALMQQMLDPIDAMSYADRLVSNRYPGRQPLVAAVHMAINDSQVRNLVTEWVVRSAEIPLVTPSPKEVWGLQTITAAPPDGAPAGTSGALFVYDEQVEPPPEGNVPPATDNKTHQTVRLFRALRSGLTAAPGCVAPSWRAASLAALCAHYATR